MIKKIFIGLVTIIAIFLIAAAMQPDTYRVERSVTIAAPPAAVFPEVNDLHQMDGWSPWKKYDPAARQTYAGPAVGQGSSMTWVGNSQMGEGTATIAESRAEELVRMDLQFVRPFPSTATAEYTFKPQGDQTVATWAMYGESSFMSKAFGLVVSMDKMLGKEFEEGLNNLKKVVEAKK